MPTAETSRDPSAAYAGQQDLLPNTTMQPLGNGTSTSTSTSSTAPVDMHAAYNPMPMETSAACADNGVGGEHEMPPAVIEAPAAAAAAPAMSAAAVLPASSMSTTSLPPVAPPTTTITSNSNSAGINRPGLLCFRKLEPRVLLKYLEHHGLTAKTDATTEELALSLIHI